MAVRTRKDELLDEARAGLNQTIRALSEIVGGQDMWRLEPGETAFPTSRREYVQALATLADLQADL